MPRALLRFLLVLLLLGGTSPLLAQDAAPAPASSAPAASLDSLSDQLDQIKAALNDADKQADANALGDLRTSALALQQQAEQLGATLAPQKDALQTQLNVLGPAPAKGAPPEPPELSTQRRQVAKAMATLEGQVKQASLLGQTALRLAAQAAQMRRDQFQAQLASRTATPFGRAFWSEPRRSLPGDLARLRMLGQDTADAFDAAWQPDNRAAFLGWLAAGLLLLSAGRWLLERALFRLARSRMPAAHLRRSVLTLAMAATSMLTIGLAAQCAYLALDWHDTLEPALDELAQALVRLVVFAAWLGGLGRALLSTRRPSWRLPALSDDAAQALRPFPWLLAALVVVLGLTERVGTAIGASLSATVITRSLLALAISGVFGAVLLRLGRARRAMQAEGEAPARRPLWIGLLVAGAFLGVVVVWLGVASGYIALAIFLARQMVWVSTIVATLYLFVHLADDLFETLLSPRGRAGKRLQDTFGLAASSLEQAATVLSGVSRALLCLLALTAVLEPYGADPQELYARTGHIFSGLKLGELTIAPGRIFDALLVFVLGLLAVRVLKRWLTEQLLPKTSLDHGMQNSLLTLLGYVGGVLAFLLALAALHVDLQSIAWVASALSVGIGFGLQQIVSNFISGLILLAERPVKVGDWVSIGGVEGDVRRINVRATEIQMSDRSTMIVPNSQFITSNVRNVTHGQAQGRVQIKLPMPLDTDAGKARQLILEAMAAHPATLETPAPLVQMDSLDGGSMTFVATAYVRNPRDAGGVKSDLLFEILQRLRDADLPMTSPQSMVVRTLGPPAPQESAFVPKA
jgi:small-conductance mechanosensitive channel